MLEVRWKKCCACGTVTDFDEKYCPAGCKDNERFEAVFPSKDDIAILLLKKNIWTKWPDQLMIIAKEKGLL